jgi:hypothetical protein
MIKAPHLVVAGPLPSIKSSFFSNFSRGALQGTFLMKLNKNILAVSAVLATTATALALKPAKHFGAGTLATYDKGLGVYTNVACARGPLGIPCSIRLTYYTRIGRARIGRIAYAVGQ